MKIRDKEVKVGQRLVCVKDVEVLGDVQVEVGEIVEVLDFDDKNCKFTMDMGFGVGSHKEMNDHFAVTNLPIDSEEDDEDEEYDDDCMDYDDYYGDEDDDDDDDDNLVGYSDEDKDDNGDEPKFKLGDKVRIINDGLKYHHNYDIGEVVTIKSYGLGAYICENSNGHTQYVKEESLVLVTEEDEDYSIMDDIDEYVSWLIETSDEIGFERIGNEYISYIKLSNGVRVEQRLRDEIGMLVEFEKSGIIEDEMFEKLADKLVEMEKYRSGMNKTEIDYDFEKFTEEYYGNDYKVIDCNKCKDCPECTCEDTYEEDERFSDYYRLF